MVIGGDAGQPYLVSAQESPAVKAFGEMLDQVEKGVAGRISLKTVEPAAGCGCGGSCDPEKCDC